MTPQGLRKAIKLLETEFGAKLCATDHSGIVPTEAGKKVYRFANNMQRQYTNTKKSIESINFRDGVGVELVFTLGTGVFFDTNLWEITVCNENKINFLFIQQESVVRERLKNGAADCAVILGNEGWEAFNRCPISDVPLYAVLDSMHPLATREELVLADLEKVPLISMGPEYSAHIFLDKLFRERQLTPCFRYITLELNLILDLISSDSAITVCVPPDFMVYDQSNLKIIRITDAVMPLGIVYPTPWQSEHVDLTIRMLKEYYRYDVTT